MDLSALTQSLEIGTTNPTSQNYELYLAKLGEFNTKNADNSKFDKILKPGVVTFLLQLMMVCLNEISLEDESSTQSKLLQSCMNCMRLLTRDGTTTAMADIEGIKTIATTAGLFYQELPFCQAMKTSYSTTNQVRTSTWIEGTKTLMNIIYVNYREINISDILACIQKVGVLEHLLERLKVYIGDSTTFPLDMIMYDLKLFFLITACSSSERGRVLEETNGFHTVCSLIHQWLHFSFRPQPPTIAKKYLTTETVKNIDPVLLEEGVPLTSNLLFDALCAPGLPEEKVVALIVDSLKILFSLTANWTAEFYLKSCNKDCLRLLYNDLRLVAISFSEYSHSENYTRLFNDCVNLLMNIPYSLIPVLIPKLATSVLTPRSRELTAPSPPLPGASKEKVQSALLLVPYEDCNLSLIKLLSGKLDENLIKNEYKCDELTLTKITLFPTLRTLARGNPIVRHYLRKRVLPPLRMVTARPEDGGDIRARIIKLMTHPDYQLAQSTADFLFVLCKENVDRMVKYTGFGNAAGLLMQRGLLGGGRHEGEADYSSDSQDSDTEEFIQCQENLNPITGAPKPPEEASPLDTMTDEEKEREAAELMDKIEKLNRTGVIKMIGPSGKAVEPRDADPNET